MRYYNTCKMHQFEFDLSEHKMLEFRIDYDLRLSFNISLYFRQNCDHEGVSFEFKILGLGFELDFYDKRHEIDKEEDE